MLAELNLQVLIPKSKSVTLKKHCGSTQCWRHEFQGYEGLDLISKIIHTKFVNIFVNTLPYNFSVTSYNDLSATAIKAKHFSHTVLFHYNKRIVLTTVYSVQRVSTNEIKNLYTESGYHLRSFRDHYVDTDADRWGWPSVGSCSYRISQILSSQCLRY